MVFISRKDNKMCAGKGWSYLHIKAAPERVQLDNKVLTVSVFIGPVLQVL